MSQSTPSRTQGLLLIGVGVLGFLGTTAQWLPAVVFFPALAICVLGVIVFARANHSAVEREDTRIRRALDPAIRNVSAERFAEQQARLDGRALEGVAAREVRPAASASATKRPAALRPPAPGPDELVLELVDAEATAGPTDDADGEDIGVSTDVSFPIELQQSQSLAEQLQKLNRLRQDGVISDAEFAIAKAKLLA